MIQTASMVLRGGTRLLAEVLGDAAPRDARLLMAHAMAIAPDRLTLELSRPITPAQVATFESMIKRRVAGEPVSKITGKRLFWGRTFKVTADVLDPRPETEVLIAEALKTPAVRILDLGTGTGCILLTLLAEMPQATGVGSDTSRPALDVAQDNAAALGLTQRAAFQRSDWFQAITGEYDLIVSNPPYIAADEIAGLSIEVRAHDPLQALSPGGDGLDAYRAIAARVGKHLAPQGRLLLEIGPTQAGPVTALLRGHGFSDAEVVRDLDGRDRVIVASLPDRRAESKG